MGRGTSHVSMFPILQQFYDIIDTLKKHNNMSYTGKLLNVPIPQNRQVDQGFLPPQGPSRAHYRYTCFVDGTLRPLAEGSLDRQSLRQRLQTGISPIPRSTAPTAVQAMPRRREAPLGITFS